MAKKVFNESKTYMCRLFGHAFINFPENFSPRLKGSLAADTIEINDPVFGKGEYAVFTVNEPENGEFPPAWVGTYRLPMAAKDSWFGGEV